MMKNMMHLKIKQNRISPYVLLPGDPLRVDLIGKFLKDFRIVNQNREFRIGKGTYKNNPITVCSTGIGSPSTAIVVEELASAGAKILIRIGTCGGAWKKNITLGSLIIPTACVRDEGTTIEYIPSGFPAVADFEVALSLAQSAETLNNKYFMGINRTHDAFYGKLSSTTRWGEYLIEKDWKNYDSAILSSDMETSALFVIASLKGIRAGAILAVNSQPEDLKSRLRGKKHEVVAESSRNKTEKIVIKAIKTALGALTNLTNI